ncbi:MAG: MFS transporter [Promethearchaeota archaeon]
METEDGGVVDIANAGRAVPKKQLVTYGFMVGSRNISAVAIGMYSFAYIIDVFGLKLELYIIANSIFLFYNALNDVLFGIFADRSRFKLGRRIPFIRYGSLFIMLTTFLFWYPMPGTVPGDPDVAQIAKFAQFLIALFVNDTITTVVGVSFGAWVPEITESDAERTKIAFIDKIANFVGGLAAPVLPMLYNNGINFFRLFLIFGNLAYTVAFFIGSFILKERPALYRNMLSSKPIREIFKSFFVVYKKRGFFSVLLFGFSQFILWKIIVNYSRLIGYGMGLSSGEILVTGIYYIQHYSFFLVLRHLSKKIPMDRLIIRVVGYCLAGFSALFVVLMISGNVWLFIPLIMISGIMASVNLFSIPIFCNVIDQDEIETFERRESLYNAAFSLIMIPAEQVLGIIVAAILNVFDYHEAVGFNQPPLAILGIRVVFFSVTFAGSLLSLISIKLYPFKGERLIRLKKEILELHALKEKRENGVNNNETLL